MVPFAADHAALGVFLDHIRTEPLWAAAKPVRTIILQTSAGMDGFKQQLRT